MNKNNQILCLLTMLIMSSCGLTYDAISPKAEEKRRNYICNTYNYEDFKMREDYKGQTYITELNTANKTLLLEKHNARINEDGSLDGINEYTGDSEEKFGLFQSYFEVNKAMSFTGKRSTASMKGFSWKIPQTFTAKNHKPKTVNLIKKIRIGPAIGNIYPLLGLGFFLEGGHLWKMKKTYDVVLEPTNAYKEYCARLYDLAQLIKDTKNCEESKKEIEIEDSYIVDVEHVILLEKKFIKDYNVIKVSNVLPKKPTEEINQSHIDEVINCIDKINNRQIFFASNNEAKVYFDIILAAEEKEKIKARNKAIAEGYDIFLNKEMLCDNDQGRVKQKDVWIILAEQDSYGSKRDVNIKNNYYSWILQQDNKINFKVRNIGIITTKEVYTNTFFQRIGGVKDYSETNTLFCSKKAAQSKIKDIKSEQKIEIAIREKAKKDAFEKWLNKEVNCSGSVLKKRKGTWIISKKNNKRAPIQVKSATIDNYKNFENNFFYKEKHTSSYKIYYTTQASANQAIKERKEALKKYEKEEEEKRRIREENRIKREKEEAEQRERDIMFVANRIQKCLGAFKKGYIKNPSDYTVNNCPYGWNCKINIGTENCLNAEKGNRLYDEAIDWLNERSHLRSLIEYWNDNNKSGQDIY